MMERLNGCTMMITKIFNTPHEVSIRFLLTLYVSQEKQLKYETITALDFLSIYSKDFDISEFNLNGNNPFNFSEFASNKKTTKEAIKLLVVKNLVDINTLNKSFVYKINSNGIALCDSLHNNYSKQYIEQSKLVKIFTQDMTERSIMSYVNKKAINHRERS